MKRALFALLLLGAGVAAGVASWRLVVRPGPAAAPADALAARPAPPASAPAPAPTQAPPEPAAENAPAPAAEPTEEEPGGSWDFVDLEEVRRALPHNLYWEQAMPTDNERVLRQREDDRARWNVEYGKVLSGNATLAEIEAYYAHRQRLSADYVEFVSYVLDHYQDEIPERDVGLLELARRLHLARLEEIPKRIQEATLRKQQQDEAREAWLADEADFESADPQ
jgi:hypothetical protein